jgi:phage-related minor tail protein
VGDTLTFDLVARDKSVSQAFNQVAKAGDQLASKLDASGKQIASGMEKSFQKAGKSGVLLERSADGVIKAFDQAGQKMDRSFKSAASSIASDLNRVEREAWEAGGGISQAFATSLRDARAELDRLRVEGARTGAGLESSLGNSLRSVKQEAGRLASSVKSELQEVEQAGKEAGEGLGSALSDGLSSALDSTGGGPLASLASSLSGVGAGKLGMLGAGLAIGGLLMDGIADAIERRKVGALVAAQTGQVAGSAQRMGNIAGDLFANSFGESVQDVGQALTAVFQNKLIDTSAADADIAHLTGKILTISDTMQEESIAISEAAHALLVNGMAGNVSEALDLIQHGAESGLNIAGDFIDTITEYSSMFRKVGLDGAESFGLLGQALKAGARDTDYAADAIKEFQIRAQDGSVLTARGFRTLGLNAKQMGADVAAGGEPAKQALRDVLNALQAMPPGVERSTAAVDLFGTKAEDLGEALYHMDLDSAAQQFGDYAGSVQEASDRLSEGVTGAEKLGKGFENAKADVGDFLYSLGNVGSSGLDDLQGKFSQVALAMEKWKTSGDMSWIDEVKKKFPELSGQIDAYVAKHQAEVDANNNVTASVQEQVDTLDELIRKKQEAAGLTLGVREAESAYQQSIDDATASIEKNGRAHDFNTQKGRDNNAALDNLAKAALNNAAAMAADGRSTDAVNKKMQAARGQFISTARSMGYTKAEAQALATKLGLIPGNYNAQVRALGIAAAKSSVQGLINRINNIPRIVNVSVNVHGNEMAARGIPTGGYQQRASGGPVKANSLYRVGEEGEEWFVPHQDGTIIPNDAIAAGAASLSPFGPGGRPTQTARADVHMHIHGSSSMAEAIKGDVRTGKIRFVVDGTRVKVA